MFRTTYDYDCIFCVQTVTESTVADEVETTASDVGDRPDCAGAKEFFDRAHQGLEEEQLAEMSKDPKIGGHVWKFFENTCIEICACKEAQSAFEVASNSIEKTAMKAACDLACAGVEGETCGFFVNGLSFVLFAILAIFKY